MSLGKRLFTTGGGATCLTENVNAFTGDSADGGVFLYSLDYDASDASGTADGTPTDVTFGVGGNINTAGRFNGSSSFINTNYTLTTDTTFSFSWWMNAEIPASGNHYIMNDGNGTVHDGTFGIYHNSSGQLGVFTGVNGGITGGLLSISGGLTGSYMHFVVSVNGTTATVYKNGSSEGTITVGSHTTAGVLTLILGRLGHFNGFYLNGDLDQVRYFSKAISSGEVTKLFNETACVHTATTTDINFPTTNLAYYKLDNSAEDSHGNTYDGTETDIVYKFGRYGQAAVFNGSSRIEVSNASKPSLSTVTVSFWLKSTETSTQALMGEGYSNDNWGNLQIALASNKLSVRSGNASTTDNSSVASTSDVNTGVWVHCAVTMSGNTVQIFINGTLETTQTLTVTRAATTNPFTIGQMYANGVLFNNWLPNCSIDQVRMFSSVLSASQVTELYNEKPEVDTSNFKAVLYEGNASTNYISNVGIDLETNGGFVWTKSRTDAYNHMLYDSVRGATNYLESNGTSQNQTNANTLMSFEANGFFLGASDNSNYTSGGDGVSWVWKGGGTAVTIAVNSITGSTPSVASDVSANTAAGFSIVKWSGDGTTSQTVAHGLSSAPQIVITKSLSSSPWYVLTTVYSAINPAYLVLNTSAQALSATFTSTATTFTNFAYSGDTIAYCFHSVSGYSKISTYPGSNSGVTVYTTDDGSSSGANAFEPSMVIIKNLTQTDPWGIFDNKRPSGTGFRSYLYPSTADDEDVYGGSLSGVTLTSTGFTINNANSNMVNEDGETFIYMAFK